MEVMRIKFGDIVIEKNTPTPSTAETWAFTMNDDSVVEKKAQVFEDGD